MSSTIILQHILINTKIKYKLAKRSNNNNNNCNNKKKKKKKIIYLFNYLFRHAR